MTLIADVFPKLLTRKTWLSKCLKSPVSENPATNNMVRRPKQSLKTLTYLLITVKAIELEKISLSYMQSLKNVC